MNFSYIDEQFINGHPYFSYNINLVIYEQPQNSVVINTQLFDVNLSGTNPFYEFHFDTLKFVEQSNTFYDCYITDLTSYITGQPKLELFLDSQLTISKEKGKKIRIPLSFTVKNSLQNKNRVINVSIPVSDYIVLSFNWDAMINP